MSKNRRHNRWGTHSGTVTSKHGRSGPDPRSLTLQEHRGDDSAEQQLADENSLIHPAEEALWDDEAGQLVRALLEELRQKGSAKDDE